MKWLISCFLLLACSTPGFASTSERAAVRLLVMEFFTDLTARGGAIQSRLTWSDSPLVNANHIYGAVVHDYFRLNDIRIWMSGNRAIVSAHTSEARYYPVGPSGLGGPRDICTRQLDVRRRNGEWRLYEIKQAHCRFVGR